MQVLHYQRRRRPTGNFSLEFIFEDVRERLVDQCPIAMRESPYFSNGIVRRLLVILDAWWHQAEITHVTGDINFAILGIKRKAALLTVLDCGFLPSKQGWARTIIKKVWLDWPVQRACKVTAISNAVREEIIQLTGCCPDKVEVVPVAISQDFHPVPRAFNFRLPRILVVGTSPNKNISRIVAACQEIPCVLVILGVIPDQILQQLRESRVRYENYFNLPQPEVVSRYVGSDMVCFASTYEGFGMPILEGQAVGRPVVTSLTSSMPEVAGDAACLVDPFDVQSIRGGIQRVVADQEYREDLVARGFANVQRFSAQRIAHQYMSVYQSMLSKQ